MAINLETGEWFSMGEVMEGMTKDERRRYLTSTQAALTGALEAMENGRDPDIPAVNRVVTGDDAVDGIVDGILNSDTTPESS